MKVLKTVLTFSSVLGEFYGLRWSWKICTFTLKHNMATFQGGKRGIFVFIGIKPKQERALCFYFHVRAVYTGEK